jgi:hypothetical protein
MVFVICFTLTCYHSFAQNAKISSIIVPQWATEQDYTEPHLSGKWHGEMKKVIMVLASWMQESYPDPHEFNPAWSGAYYSGKDNVLPVLKYEMRVGFYPEDSSNLSAGPNQGTTVTSATSFPEHTMKGRFVITVNDLSLLQQSLVCYRTPYALLRPMKELDKGVYYNEINDEKEDTAELPVTRRWLITYAGKLPYTFISRKEYLEEAKKELMTDKERVREHLKQLIPMRSPEEEEAAKKRDLQEIENMYSGTVRANRKRIYLESYKPDSVYFNETLSSRAAPLDSASSLIDSLLSRSSAESLGKPACISRPALSFKGFEDGLPGSRMLVRWNPDYFNKNISPVRPQFLVVTWQYDPADSIAASIDKQLIGKLDLRDLTALLDK